jgi:hypothetical protein
MTVSLVAVRWSYVPNGVTTSFAYLNLAFSASELVCSMYDANNAPVALPSYTVTGLFNPAGGNVVFDSPPPVPAAAPGRLIVELVTVADSDIICRDFTPEPATERQAAWDKPILLALEARDAISRTVRAHPSDLAPLAALPPASQRANTILGFDGAGNPIAAAGGAAPTVPISAAMVPVVTAGTLVDARSAMGMPDGAGFSIKGVPAGAPSGPPQNLTAAQAMAGLLSIGAPGHRLTLTPATKVTTADVLAAATLILTPCEHNMLAIMDGASLWTPYSLAETSLALSATGHLLGKNYDVFVENTTGTPRLVTGPAWTSDVLRADLLAVTAGREVNVASMLMRFGPAGGDTVAVAAGRGLFLGPIRRTANAQIEDSAARRFAWNRYNRRPRPMKVIEATDSWTYNSTAFRQSRAFAGNQLDFVRGLDEDVVAATLHQPLAGSAAGDTALNAIGLDSTTTVAADSNLVIHQVYAGGVSATNVAGYIGLPGLGRHTLVALEAGTTLITFSGDGGVTGRNGFRLAGTVMA